MCNSSWLRCQQYWEHCFLFCTNFYLLFVVLFHRTCNLATQCLRSEFSQQIRAHEFIPKITSSLADLLDHPVRRERERERERYTLVQERCLFRSWEGRVYLQCVVNINVPLWCNVLFCGANTVSFSPTRIPSCLKIASLGVWEHGVHAHTRTKKDLFWSQTHSLFVCSFVSSSAARSTDLSK